MNIAILYRCENLFDIEQANLSIAQFKDKNTENIYKFVVSCNEDIETIPESSVEIEYIKLSINDTLTKLAELTDENRLVIISDVCTVCIKSLEPLFEQLINLDSYWQVCGNMEFSFATVSNGTNMNVCTDYTNSYISSRFCILNSYFANASSKEEYLELINLGEEDEDLDAEDIFESGGNFYEVFNLVLNTTNWERIVMPEIVYDTGYNLRSLDDGYVAVMSAMDLDNPDTYDLCNINHYYLPILYNFVENNETNISDEYKQLIFRKSMYGVGDTLKNQHDLEYIEAKVGTNEWKLVI